MIQAGDITPVVMIGGPKQKYDFFAAQGRPKPFLKLLSAHSPFQQTILRCLPFRKPVIVCDAEFKDIVIEQLQQIGVEAGAIILEPIQKGTAAALALAAFLLKGENGVMAVMPSSPAWDDPHQDIVDAALYADQMMILLGQRVQRGKKRYGFIQSDYKQGERCHPVRHFVERPVQAGLNDNKGVFWSSGYMLCRPRFYLDTLMRLEPELYRACERAYYAGNKNGNFVTVDARNFEVLDHQGLGLSILERVKQTGLVEMKSARA